MTMPIFARSGKIVYAWKEILRRRSALSVRGACCCATRLQKHFSVLLRINKFEFNLPENDGKPRPHAHRPLILVVHLSSSSARAGSARLDKRHTNEIVVLNVIRLRAIF